jgi:ubiquinone/menaquinone biosynthesis C-methylase UbiE
VDQNIDGKVFLIFAVDSGRAAPGPAGSALANGNAPENLPQERNEMTAQAGQTVAERISHLLRHLNIERAHFAASMPRDWEGLVTTCPDSVSSLTLVCPMGVNLEALRANSRPLLILTGDRGRSAEEVRRSMAALPGATWMCLPDYTGLPWSDTLADRTKEIGSAMTDFLARSDESRRANAADLREGEGEIDEISYSIRGSGPALVLFPLALAPSQWQPLLPLLSERYSTVTLGGPRLGMIAHLEARARAGYLGVIRRVVDEVQLRPGQAVLEVGCGSGSIVRWLAGYTGGANRIVALDVNRYLLREAAALAKKENVAGALEFREGNGEALPFAADQFDVTLSFTVLEEGDADRMLAEFARVTKPGGKVAVIVRSTDMPRWVNLPLSSELKKKVEAPQLLGGNVQENGCADASLYGRLQRTGLVEVKMIPQLASHAEGERLQYMQDRIVAALGPAEIQEWRAAIAQAGGSFFIAEPFHCAVGTKA